MQRLLECSCCSVVAVTDMAAAASANWHVSAGKCHIACCSIHNHLSTCLLLLCAGNVTGIGQQLQQLKLNQFMDKVERFMSDSRSTTVDTSKVIGDDVS